MLAAFWENVASSVGRLRRLGATWLLAIGSLALAFTASVSAFSVLYATVLRPAQAPAPDRLFAVTTTDARTGQTGAIYRTTYDTLRDALAPVSTLAMYSTSLVRLQAGTLWLDAGATAITPEYFSIAGVRLLHGRPFTAHDIDSAAGPDPVIIISERLRNRLSANGLDAVGTSILVEGRRAIVVGVASDTSGILDADVEADAYVPITLARTLAGDSPATARAPTLVGRLADGVSLGQVRVQLETLWPSALAGTTASLPAAVQQSLAPQRPVVESLANGFSGLRRQYGGALAVLTGLALVILAIGVVNVAGAVSVAALARRHEMALRLALGATRMSLLRQQLLDGVLLSLGALTISLPAAWWATRMGTAMVSVARPLPLELSLVPDRTVLAVAFASATVIGLVVGVVPGWIAVGTRPEDIARSTRTTTEHQRATTVFLVAQVALSLVLATGALLAWSTLRELRDNYATLPVGDVLWTRLARNPAASSPDVDREYLQGLTERLAAIPGVESAVLSAYFPAFLGFVGTLPQDEYSRIGSGSVGTPVRALTELVSPGFFGAFGIALSKGRDVRWDDDDRAPAVVVVNQAMATSLFPAGDGLGQSIRLGSGPGAADLTVVGTVADAAVGSLHQPHAPVAFRPMAQSLSRARSPLAHVRVSGGGAAAVRDSYVKAVEQPGRHFVRGLFTLQEWTQFALLRERMAAGLAVAAALLAALLCGVGVYALLAFSVTARTREIGVRMAVGATVADVVTMVARKGLTVTLAGIGVGAPCALIAATLSRTYWKDMSVAVWGPLGIASIVFVAIGIAASAIPGRRAANVAPWDALKTQ